MCVLKMRVLKMRLRVLKMRVRVLKMSVLETEWTRQPCVNLTEYIQLRGELRARTTLSKDFVALCGIERWCG